MSTTSGTKSEGLGITFHANELAITGLTIGKSVIITYYVNNPAGASIVPLAYSSTGITLVDSVSTDNESERIGTGAWIGVVTDTMITITFRRTSDSPSYQFTAYQV